MIQTKLPPIKFDPDSKQWTPILFQQIQPVYCICGCEYFVWFVKSQNCYSSPTHGSVLVNEWKPDTRCQKCNRPWPRRTT